MITNTSEEPWKCKTLSRVPLFVTLRPVAGQATLSMRFPRQECWSGLPFPSPGDLPKDWTRVSRTAGGFFTVWATREAQGIENRTYTKFLGLTADNLIFARAQLDKLQSS